MNNRHPDMKHTDPMVPTDFARAFKPADIRGLYPAEINEAVAYKTAVAFVSLNRFKKIVVGYDMRISTPALKKAFIDGARDAGADVIEVGMVHSPLLYFASGQLKLPGAMVTASHSPAAFNGIKLVYSEAVPLTGPTGLNDIKKFVAKEECVPAKKRGALKKQSFKADYLKYVLKQFDTKKFKSMSIAADIGNGMAADPVAMLDKKTPASFTTLFADPDGSFPNRGSDPCLKKNQRQLHATLKQGGFDFGVGFDGDGDRIAFSDEKGRYVNCAVIGALIAERLLEREPKAGIVYTNLTSRIFEETIKANKGKALRARVGHTFLKEKLCKQGGVFGAEHSGHFFWRDFYHTDSVVLTLLTVMEIYVEHKAAGKTFSEMLKPYQQYQQTEDEVIHVENKKACLGLIEKKLQKMKPKTIKKFDGFFVDFGDVWGAVKPSVTEFAIKLMFESKKKADAKKVQKELVEYVKSIASKK